MGFVTTNRSVLFTGEQVDARYIGNVLTIAIEITRFRVADYRCFYVTVCVCLYNFLSVRLICGFVKDVLFLIKIKQVWILYLLTVNETSMCELHTTRVAQTRNI